MGHLISSLNFHHLYIGLFRTGSQSLCLYKITHMYTVNKNSLEIFTRFLGYEQVSGWKAIKAMPRSWQVAQNFSAGISSQQRISAIYPYNLTFTWRYGYTHRGTENLRGLAAPIFPLPLKTMRKGEYHCTIFISW